MEKTLAMISTGSAIIPELTRIAKELNPEINLIHYLDDGIISDIANHQNTVSVECLQRLFHLAQAAELGGASAILVTCSSISEFVDAAQPFLSIPIYKIDEPMLETALERGTRIGIMATVATTLAPTIRQLKTLAKKRGKDIQIEYCLEEAAFRAHLEGKTDLHDALIQHSILELCSCCDAVVLAQVSMTLIVYRLPNDEARRKILTSPYSGIKNALDQMTEAECQS